MALSRINSSMIGAGDVSNTEHAYLNSVTSNVQTQIDGAGGNYKNGMTDFNLASATGTKITVTGLGFTPTHIIIQVVMSTTTQMVVFSMMGNSTHSIVTGPASTAGTYTWNNDPQLLTGSGIYNLLDLESLDSDGFTLDNTKSSGSPTGTAKVQWMAFG